MAYPLHLFPHHSSGKNCSYRCYVNLGGVSGSYSFSPKLILINVYLDSIIKVDAQIKLCSLIPRMKLWLEPGQLLAVPWWAIPKLTCLQLCFCLWVTDLERSPYSSVLTQILNISGEIQVPVPNRSQDNYILNACVISGVWSNMLSFSLIVIFLLLPTISWL